MRAHPLGGFRRAQEAHADQQEHLIDQAQLLDSGHELPEAGNIETILCLNELRARRDLLREPQWAPIERRCTGIFCRAEKHARREGDLATALETMLIAQGVRDIKEGHAVEIKDRLRLWMITGLHAVPRETQQVAHAHGRSAKYVALYRDSVSIAAGDSA
jgi:hypothetical protein